MENRFPHLIRIFGSHSAVARAANADTGYVHRWPPKKGLNTRHTLGLLETAKREGKPLAEVVWAINPPRCKCCNAIIDDEVREWLANVKA